MRKLNVKNKRLLLLMVILKEYSVYYKSMNNNPQKHNDVNFATKLYNERKITVYMISFIIMLLLSLHSYKIYVTF